MKKLAALAGLFALVAGLCACSELLGSSTKGNGDATGTIDTSGVSGAITTATTWTKDTYVSGSVSVKSPGSLAIAAGVTVTFASDTYLSVEAGAALSAVGTAAKPVTFSSVNGSTYWRALYLNGTNTTLKYVSISRAGNSSYGHPAIVFDTSGATADIENCTIAGNLSGGINAADAGTGTIISNNSFGNNGDNGDNGSAIYDLEVSGAIVTATGNVAISGTNSYTVLP